LSLKLAQFFFQKISISPFKKGECWAFERLLAKSVSDLSFFFQKKKRLANHRGLWTGKRFLGWQADFRNKEKMKKMGKKKKKGQPFLFFLFVFSFLFFSPA
jgi:hypothetical protein